MSKQEYRRKCAYFSLTYLGKWDDKHWAMKCDHAHAPYLGGMVYELTNDFVISEI